MTTTDQTLSESSVELPAVDPEALARLERFGGIKLRDEMIALFLTAAPERIDAARAGVQAGDAHAAELAFHSLKSSSAQLGAMRMGRLSEQGECLGRSGTVGGLGEIVDEMDAELVRVREWLATVKGERRP